MLLTAEQNYPDAKKSLETWYRITKKALWMNINEVRAVVPHADPVGNCVVFNIGGNKYRLITGIAYASRLVPGQPRFRGVVYTLKVLPHDEYSTDKWKKECGC
jgi:mRNA interferase HigB